MTKWIEKSYAYGLLIVFAGIVIHTPLTVWLGTVLPDSSALVIKSWKEVLLFLLIPVALWLVTKHRLWQEFGKSWIFRLIVCYALLHMLLIVVMWQGGAQTLAGIGIDLRYVLFFALVYTLVRVAPEYKQKLIAVAVAGAVIVVGFALLQQFLPADILTKIGYSEQTIKPYQTVDENPDYIRVNSTLRGPNPLGAYAGLVLILVVSFAMGKYRWSWNRQRERALVLLGVASAVVLWVSYSRSAVAAALIGILVVALAGVKKLPAWTWWCSGAAIVITLVALALARDSTFVQTVIIHDNPSTGAQVTSNDDHITSLSTGFDRLLGQPLGGGVGSTGSASLLGTDSIIIENQYLFIAHETGWLGLILFGCLFAAIMQRLWARRNDWLARGVFGGGVSLALIGLLLPVWTDDTVSIVWWGLAALAIGGRMYGKKSAK